MRVSDALESPVGAAIVSALLGLGLAAVFRRTCTGPECVVVRAPDLGDLGRHTYRIGQTCYRYTPEAAPCPGEGGGAPDAPAVSLSRA